MKRVLKIALLLGLLGGIGLAVVAWKYWRVRDYINQWQYDRTHEQTAVNSVKKIQAILAEFERVSYAKLDPEYLSETLSDQSPYKGMLSAKRYYLIPEDDIYRKIVGHYRIKDFLPKDAYYRHHVVSMGESEGLYWLINPKLLYAFLGLQNELKAQKYRSDGFVMVNGYRHPAYNKAKGGASRSRHMLGEAVDILIKDINGDGRNNQADKDIVLKILDEKVIANKGGLGRYPGTMSVHFDVRGRRARWDKQ
ncbi:MAG: YcbK family protein [Bacteroidia bacterium]